MQGSVDRASHVELAPEARCRAVCGEGVVLNQTAAEVIVVSPVGLRVLELMEEDGAVAGILDRLHGEYEVEAAALEQDVLAFLGEMMAAGPVRLAAGATGP